MVGQSRGLVFMTKKLSQPKKYEIKSNPATKEAEGLIHKAIERGVDVATMERLLAMRTELKREWAKEQYDNAMARLQGEMPIIKRNKPGGKTRAGQVAYYYAPLESIILQTKHIIENNGFSYAIQTQTGEGVVKVTCLVTHSAGHTKESSVELPLGTKTDIMSETQRVAAAMTFAKRYAFCNAFGIMTADEDNDAQEFSNQVDVLEKALALIMRSTDPIALKDYRQKIEKQKLKSDEKKKLMTAVDDRLKRISQIIDAQQAK